ncbi:TetR/AcrR family transcriptional regulator [Teredinibacter turnerae]|uniref:TetR/AcrR family transcriptional regulator n=1 Tax=Teredinibacter turnerae TaxID=2426 RepID=UPI00037CC8F2|nr:TetR/AcrR family transcriptional regulator [Teredinibacter turnerae]
MAQAETVEKILNAALVLFAERGFAETSLRTITGMADVNLAAVNYHFGSKKELIQAVFSKFLQPFCEILETELDSLEAAQPEGGAPSAEEVISCVLDTMLKTTSVCGVSVQRLTRLLNLAYTQSQEHLRHHLVANFGKTYHRMTTLMHKTMPGVSPVEFYWRLYFMLGAAVFTLSSFDSLRSILNTDYSTDTELEEVLHLMVPALAGMLRSPHDPT